ncbi:hypothetical protein [Maritimibacter sp. UBA3975]|uniref:hypothetical protein n=1 Tax=Maritimibacter sp. UBA3975 TaxID=1946833 RepID=UPI000C090AA0|nr:hypothetical protein [Maritimibacter sp. UBA3975]MAM62096.1 hypothetical protein [Maritimibacter sp.]
MPLRRAVPLVAVLSLAACAMPIEVDQPPVPYITLKPLNEVGRSSFTVRAFNEESGRAREMSGIPCTFGGDGFVSTFTAPAVVTAPNMGPRTPPASVKCSYDGRTKTRSLTPVNQTIGQIAGTVSAGANAGVVGVLVGGAVAAAQTVTRDKEADVWGYPDVSITFD